jgi:hypothetical protein
MIEGTKPEASTPEESGTTPKAVPYPDPDGGAPTNGRQALRAARRRRRRISIVCAVFIAGCTAITLLIVGIASSRASSPQSAAPVTARLPGVPVDLRPLPDRQSLTRVPET